MEQISRVPTASALWGMHVSEQGFLKGSEEGHLLFSFAQLFVGLREFWSSGGWDRLLNRVALDKIEGVVKRHFSPAVLCSTVWLPEWLRTEALKLSR